MDFTPYTTLAGERWDTISQKAYGNPFLAEIIINANPDLPVNDLLEPGTVIALPILEAVNENIDRDLLPPWKR